MSTTRNTSAARRRNTSCMPVRAAIVSTSLAQPSKTCPRRSVRSKVTVSRYSSWVTGCDEDQAAGRVLGQVAGRLRHELVRQRDALGVDRVGPGQVGHVRHARRRRGGEDRRDHPREALLEVGEQRRDGSGSLTTCPSRLNGHPRAGTRTGGLVVGLGDRRAPRPRSRRAPCARAASREIWSSSTITSKKRAGVAASPLQLVGGGVGDARRGCP